MNAIENTRRHGRRVGLVGLLCTALLGLAASSALAAAQWQLEVQHGPTIMVPGELGQYALIAQNIGDTTAGGSGSPITITSTLPDQAVATDASGTGWNCGGTAFPAQVVTCSTQGPVPPATFGPPPGSIDDFNLGLRGMAQVLYINVLVDADATGTGVNEASVSGGGASESASVSDATLFDSIPTPFGLRSLAADAFDAEFPDGEPVRQAGAHPFEARFDLAFNLKGVDDPNFGFYAKPVEDVHTIEVTLPDGFVGDPEATPKCTHAQLSELAAAKSRNSFPMCPSSSQVGTADLILQGVGNRIITQDLPDESQDIPVYNMEPARGTIADFAFMLVTVPAHLVASLDPAHHYAVKTTITNIPNSLPIRSSKLTLWGVPADAAHDKWRFHPSATDPADSYFGTAANQPLKPFLTLPSQCGVPGQASARVASWRAPETFVGIEAAPASMSGCEKQRFEASVAVQPTTLEAGAPTGLAVDVNVTQDQHVPGLGTPPLKKAVVTLPAGMAVSPSSADGLASCTPAQIGLGTNSPVACPDAAKIGTALLRTPVLPDPISGSVYLAAQNQNPFGSLLALYIVLEDKDRGLLIKLPGKVALDPSTGQLTSTFDENPQVPFSSLHLQLKSGPWAPLVNPTTCGVKTATAALTSWNASLPTVNATDSFTISGDGQGGACTHGFHPVLEAGTENPIAGKDSTLVTRITRPDGDQELDRVDVTMPQGVLGRISKVALCKRAAATAGVCGEGSRIGSATVLAGPGSNPFAITNGRLFLTGPYRGAPFGLSILVHAKAGPLDLGNVNVRAAVRVNRRTAALRIVTDPLPRMLAGIPLLLRVAEVAVDRPRFTFNPTDCSEKRATGRITSTAGTVARVSSRFQVGECGRLSFRPRLSFRVGRRGHTGAGASVPLTTTVRMPRGGANLASVRVVLPGLLTARLGVVGEACTREAFDVGDCARARAGSAIAVTPLLAKPLRGSAYFVKTAEKGRLPDLVVALRGQVDVDLTGKVKVTKGGLLSTSFDTVPDVPITKFVLRLVDGKNGPLATVRSLCTRKARSARVDLTLRAQNGKRTHRTPRFRITGCPKR